MSAIHPGRYRHYKGNEYTVLDVARHSETLEELVVYFPAMESASGGPPPTSASGWSLRLCGLIDQVVATSRLSQSSRPSPKSAIHTNRARSSLPWAVSGQRSTRKKLTGTESGSRRAAAQAAKASAPGSAAFGRSS